MIDPTPHLERFESYEQARREFRWRIPDRFNIASAISKRHQDAVTRTALDDVRPGGINTYTFGGIDLLSDKFANLLAQSGVRAGDSVAVILSQSAALLVAHFGALKLGAVVVPLSTSLPSFALRLALTECRARAIVASKAALADAGEAVSSESLFVVGSDHQGDELSDSSKDFWRQVNYASSDFTPVETSSSSPAFIFFYSNSKSDLVGVTHSHRSFIGQFTAFEMYNNFSCGEDSAFFAASDWTSPQTLLGMILPALWYGCSVVAQNSSSFSGDEFFDLMNRCEVTHALIPSPEMNRLKQTERVARLKYELKLKRILTTPDGFTQESYDWAANSLGASLNVAYGKPETGIIATGCEKWFAASAGSAGRAVPGHSIEIVDEQANILPAGERGRAALLKPDPALLLNYWNDAEKTRAALAGEWFVSDDAGYKKEDGDLYISPS
jgi:acetyl-CoA synthetase